MSDVRYIELTREQVDEARLRSDPVGWVLAVVERNDVGRYSRKGLVRQAWLTGLHLNRTLVGWAVKYLLEEGVLRVERMERRGLKSRVVRGERWDDRDAISRARVRVDAMKRGASPLMPSFPDRSRKKQPGKVHRVFRA